MSSWTTIKLSAFLAEVMMFFQSVAGLVHKSFRQNYLDFFTADFSFANQSIHFLVKNKLAHLLFSRQFQNSNPPGIVPSQFVLFPQFPSPTI